METTEKKEAVKKVTAKKPAAKKAPAKKPAEKDLNKFAKSFKDFKEKSTKDIRENPILHMGAIMMNVKEFIPEGNLLLKYISELERNYKGEDLVIICEKIMIANKKAKK